MQSLDHNPFVQYIFAVCGALLFWVRSNLHGRNKVGFGDAVALFIAKENKIYGVVEFFVFILLGGLVGMVFAGPATIRQALAGGVAWAQIAQVKERDA
jgi:hypothetical protein